MRVADVMTLSVVTVRPSASVREVARILLDHGISAVPVVDEQDRPVRIVSEGDLLRRVETGTETKRSWWLDQLSDPEDRAMRFVKEHGHTAEQVMSRELVTTTEEADLRRPRDPEGGSGRSCERGRHAGPSQRDGVGWAGAALGGGPQRRRRARSLESVTFI